MSAFVFGSRAIVTAIGADDCRQGVQAGSRGISARRTRQRRAGRTAGRTRHRWGQMGSQVVDIKVAAPSDRLDGQLPGGTRAGCRLAIIGEIRNTTDPQSARSGPGRSAGPDRALPFDRLCGSRLSAPRKTATTEGPIPKGEHAGRENLRSRTPWGVAPLLPGERPGSRDSGAPGKRGPSFSVRRIGFPYSDPKKTVSAAVRQRAPDRGSPLTALRAGTPASRALTRAGTTSAIP